MASGCGFPTVENSALSRKGTAVDKVAGYTGVTQLPCATLLTPCGGVPRARGAEHLAKVTTRCHGHMT